MVYMVGVARPPRIWSTCSAALPSLCSPMEWCEQTAQNSWGRHFSTDGQRPPATGFFWYASGTQSQVFVAPVVLLMCYVSILFQCSWVLDYRYLWFDSFQQVLKILLWGTHMQFGYFQQQARPTGKPQNFANINQVQVCTAVKRPGAFSAYDRLMFQSWPLDFSWLFENSMPTVLHFEWFLDVFSATIWPSSGKSGKHVQELKRWNSAAKGPLVADVCRCRSPGTNRCRWFSTKVLASIMRGPSASWGFARKWKHWGWFLRFGWLRV